MKRIGYLRISTSEQLPDRQVEALRPVCDCLYVETLSAVSKRRPFYRRAIRRLKAGDELVVLDIDRAFRSARDALNQIHLLDKRGAHFRILNFPIDTTTEEGHFLLTVLLAASEYERRLLSRRTREGLVVARKRGAILGRPRKLSDAQLTRARSCLDRQSATLESLAAEFHVAPWTLARNLKTR